MSVPSARGSAWSAAAQQRPRRLASRVPMHLHALAQILVIGCALLGAAGYAADFPTVRTIPGDDPGLSFAGLVNVAKGKAATATSGNAGAAVDGDTNGDFFAGSVMEATGSPLWWQVDLGQTYGIEGIAVWNRTDCCMQRLREFDLLVSDQPATAAGPGVWCHHQACQSGAPTRLFVGQNGRYVRLALRAGGDALDLAEVEVFARPQPFVAALAATPIGMHAGDTWVAGTTRRLSAQVAGQVTEVEFLDSGRLMATAPVVGSQAAVDATTCEGLRSITTRARAANGDLGPASAGIPVLVAPRPAATRIPVILDTDLGGDKDDHFALAQLLGCPELEIRLVVAEGGDGVEGRAQLVANMLEASGRSAIPIGVGLNSAHRTIANPGVRYRGTVHADGVQALIDTIMASPVRITVISIGPPINVGAALQGEPGIAAKARISAMLGDFRIADPTRLTDLPEHNAKVDVAATRALLAAPWDVTLAPYMITNRIGIYDSDAARLAGGLTARAKHLWGWYTTAWNGDRLAIPGLYDTTAVYLAFASPADIAATMEMRTMGVRVVTGPDGRDGYLLEDPAARYVTVAWRWRDYAAYQDRLLTRILVDAPE